MRLVTEGNVRGFVWFDKVDKGLGYSLVVDAATETLHPLANAIRQGIRDGF